MANLNDSESGTNVPARPVVNWQVTTGCERLTPGCDSCPSYWEAEKFQGVAGHVFEHGYDVRLWEDRLEQPFLLEEPHVITVSLGSDLFHEAVPVSFLKRVFDVMNRADRHIFEVATKRAERMACVADQLNWTSNIAAGVAIESGRYKWRIDYLRDVPADVRYLSVCPILGPLGEMDLTGIHKVGVVKEDWGYKRPAAVEWIDEIREQCELQGVSFSRDYYLYEESMDCIAVKEAV